MLGNEPWYTAKSIRMKFGNPDISLPSQDHTLLHLKCYSRKHRIWYGSTEKIEFNFILVIRNINIIWVITVFLKMW